MHNARLRFGKRKVHFFRKGWKTENFDSINYSVCNRVHLHGKKKTYKGKNNKVKCKFTFKYYRLRIIFTELVFFFLHIYIGYKFFFEKKS